MKNHGLENEFEIINELNGKYFKDLSVFWQNRIKQLHSKVVDEDVIECYKLVYNQKADIAVKVHGYKYSISIKSGYFVSVHSEGLSSFTGFLRSLGISEELIRILKLYHYGDGTIDGTGEVRKSLVEIKEEMWEDIIKFNEAVNDPAILRHIIIRFLCTGTPYQRSFVSHIYSGTMSYGYLIDAKTLIDYICSGYPTGTTSIHFGPFIYTPAYRGLENYDSSNVKRYYLNIKWPSMNRDIRDAKDWLFIFKTIERINNKDENQNEEEDKNM